MGDLLQAASECDREDASGPSARKTGVPCVENVYWKEDEVLGCLVELGAVNSTLMNPQIFSKMCLSRNTLETRLCIVQLSKCVEGLKIFLFTFIYLYVFRMCVRSTEARRGC